MTDTASAIRDIIEGRRSIRRFQQEPLPESDLREILRLASLAPTAFNVQPARFVVVQNKALQEKLQAAAYNQAQVSNAPAVIVIYSDMEDVLQNAEETVHPGVGEEGVRQQAERLRGQWAGRDLTEREQWAVSQAYITLGFLLLAARGLGYDTVPMSGFEPDKVRELLELPEHVQFAAMVPIGKRAEEGYSHHRHSVDRLTTWK